MTAPSSAAATGPADPVLAVRGLTVGYVQRGRPLTVIDNLSFEIAPGEAYGLVGESGCGKTTAAMAVVRYLPRNARVVSGQVLFRGRDLLRVGEGEMRALRGRRIAMVYQDPGSALNPSIPVGRQIAEVYRLHGGLSPRLATTAARGMLEMVQISDPARLMRHYPHELSGGQQQRIMFAMALATNPDLLVLDEPTTGLDATVEAEVLDLVEQLRAKFNAAILFISHNLGIVSRICERVGVLYAGRLVEEGPSRVLFAEPQHPYTLGLVRCVPTQDMRKDVRRLDPIPGFLPSAGVVIPGCVYAPRCPIVRPRCRAEEPPAVSPAPGRTSRCFYVEEVSRIPPGEEARVVAVPPPSAEPLLTIDGLTKTYHARGASVTAVDGVTLRLGRGEVLGLVGESGSGKSSLAKCIVGLIDATSGRIQLEGVTLTEAARSRDPRLRRRLQMLFQNPDTSLNPNHTVRRILARSVQRLLGIRGRAQIDAHLAQLMASVRLAPRYLDARPSALSGGLKQRVAIARAFAGSPALVLCDEPTSALDVSVQAAILNLLADLQGRERVSYVFISHDLGIVRYLADRLAVMYLGQLVEIGPAEAVFRPPHHPYTATLLSAMPALDPRARRTRIKLQGTMPSLADPPSGCRFHTRCPWMLGEVCRREAPPWQQDAAGHAYRCHIPPSELLGVQTAARTGAPPDRTPA
jgi:peptide/nickel transport system ATP-binding protein